MRKVLILAALMVAGCVVDETADPGATPEAWDGAEDGFGYPCEMLYPPIPLTVCYGDNHVEGMCAMNMCRRRTFDQRCAKGYVPILTVNDEWFCQPVAPPEDETLPDWMTATPPQP